MSPPLRLSRWLILLGAFSFLSACDKWFDSDDETSQTLMQTEAIPSDSVEGAMIVGGTDTNGVGIQVVVDSTLADDVTILEGLDLGLPADYSLITNGFIEIALSPEAQGQQVIRLMSPSVFEVVVALDEANAEMSYTPYLTQADGAIEFYLSPTNGSITFALMDVPEF